MHIDVEMKAKRRKFWHSSNDGFCADGQFLFFQSLFSLCDALAFSSSYVVFTFQLSLLIDSRDTSEQNVVQLEEFVMYGYD